MMVPKYTGTRFLRLPLRACCLAGLLAAAAVMQQAGAQEAKPAAAPPAAIPEMKSPRVSSVDVDWAAVHTALSDLSPLLGEDHPDGAKANTLARLNEATQSAFPNIAASPIPVLLPFDTAAFLKDKAASKGAAVDRSKYFGGFTASNVFFFPGPAGYDASILLQPQELGQPSVRQGHRCADFRFVGHLRTGRTVHAGRQSNSRTRESISRHPAPDGRKPSALHVRALWRALRRDHDVHREQARPPTVVP